MTNLNFSSFQMSGINTATSYYNCIIYVEAVRPREILEGRIEILPLKHIRLIHAYIEYMGEAKCDWELEKGTIKCPRYYPRGTKMYGSKTFYYARHNIYSGEEYTIITSKKVFNFSTKLPHGPATWKGKYGSIRYHLKVTLKFANLHAFSHQEDFIVLPHRDLTLEQHLLNEISHKSNRNYKYAMLKLGSVTVTMWLPLCGYAAGQSVPVLINVDNHSEIKFSGFILVLTMFEMYRSKTPFVQKLKYRKDICRVARMADICAGSYQFYTVLEIDENVVPTNQYSRCTCCQVIYEIWLTLQAAIPRYSGYGYPHMTTPGIPIIIGTTPICSYSGKKVTAVVMEQILSCRPPVVMEPAITTEVEELRDFVDGELTQSTIINLNKQVEESHQTDSHNIRKSDLLEISNFSSPTMDNNNSPAISSQRWSSRNSPVKIFIEEKDVKSKSEFSINEENKKI